MKITIIVPGKFHAFYLAEQLHKKIIKPTNYNLSKIFT